MITNEALTPTISYLEVERSLSQSLISQCQLDDLRQYLWDLTPTTSYDTHKLLLDGDVVSRIKQALDQLMVVTNIDHPNRLMVYHLIDAAEDDTSVTAYVSFRYAGHTAAAVLEIEMIGRIVPIQEEGVLCSAIQLTWLNQE